MCPFCCVILHNKDDIKTDNDDNYCDKKVLIFVALITWEYIVKWPATCFCPLQYFRLY